MPTGYYRAEEETWFILAMFNEATYFGFSPNRLMNGLSQHNVILRRDLKSTTRFLVFFQEQL